MQEVTTKTILKQVVCISERESVPGQFTIGESYKMDLDRAYGDADGDWYAPVYTKDGELIGTFNLKHFRTLYQI